MRPLKAITLLIILIIASSTGLPRRINVDVGSNETGTGCIGQCARNLTPVTSDELQPPQGIAYDKTPLKTAGVPSEPPETPTSTATFSGEIFLAEEITNQLTGGEERETAPRNRRAIRIPGLRIPIRSRPQLPRSPGGRSPASAPKSGSPPASPPKREFTPESSKAGRPESPSRGGPKSEMGASASAVGKAPSRKEGSKGSFPDLDDVLSAGADLADFFAGGNDSENPKDEENTRKSPSTTTTERSSAKRNGPYKGPGNFHSQGQFHPKGPGHFHSEGHFHPEGNFHPEGHFHPEGPGDFHPGGAVRFPDDDWHGW